jgi:hypothetical protein
MILPEIPHLNIGFAAGRTVVLVELLFFSGSSGDFVEDGLRAAVDVELHGVAGQLLFEFVFVAGD